MDYRALAELIWFSFLGMTALLLGGSFAIRVVLGPLVRDFIDAYRDKGQNRLPPAAEERIALLEGRILDLEDELGSVKAARDFDAQIGPGKADPKD